MAKTTSDGLPKSGTRAKRPGDRRPAVKVKSLDLDCKEHAPVTSVAQIPFVFVEIQVLISDILKSLGKIQIEDLNPIDGKEITWSMKSGQTIERLVTSCVLALLQEGLNDLGLDFTKSRIMLEALKQWKANHREHLSAGESQQVEWLLSALAARVVAGIKMEGLREVNHDSVGQSPVADPANQEETHAQI